MIDTPLPQSEPVMLPSRPQGRVGLSIALHAIGTALMILTPLLVFVPAAVFHCAMRNGRRAAWIAAVLAAGLLIAFYFVPVASVVKTAEEANMSWAFFAAVMLAIALPSLTAIPLVERGETFGRVLLFLLFGSAIGLGVTELVMRNFAAFSPLELNGVAAQKRSAEILMMYRQNNMPPDFIRLAEKMMGYGTIILPAILLIEMALVFVLSLLMLGRLRAWKETIAARGESAQGAGTYLFRNLSLPDWLLFAFLIGGLTPLAHGMLQTVAANVLTLVSFLYVLQGLAIFRSLLLTVGGGGLATLFGWGLLLLLTLMGISPLLLGIAGLFDPFFDFRHFKRKDDSHESHTD